MSKQKADMLQKYCIKAIRKKLINRNVCKDSNIIYRGCIGFITIFDLGSTKDCVIK